AGGKMKLTVICCALMLCFIAVELNATEPLMRKEVSVRPGQTLVLDLETGGTIRITGSDRQSVSMEAKLAGNSWKECEVRLEQVADGARVTSQYSGPDQSHSTSFSFDLMVPEQFNVRIESAGGDIRIV